MEKQGVTFYPLPFRRRPRQRLSEHIDGKGTGYVVSDKPAAPSARIPAGFVANNASSRWGEAVWTDRSIHDVGIDVLRSKDQGS